MCAGVGACSGCPKLSSFTAGDIQKINFEGFTPSVSFQGFFVDGFFLCVPDRIFNAPVLPFSVDICRSDLIFLKMFDISRR